MLKKLLGLPVIAMLCAGSLLSASPAQAFSLLPGILTPQQEAPKFTDKLSLYDAASAKITLTAPASTTVDYSVLSVDGAEVLKGSVPVSNGSATIDITQLGPGYYDLSASNAVGKDTTSLGIVNGLSNTPNESLYGITAHPGIHVDSVNQTAAARAVGTNLVRVDWRWEDVDTLDPKVFNWDPKVEAEIERLLAQGFRPSLVLAYNGNCDLARTPSSPECIQHYVEFVSATARKYGTKVDYAIYNEWNAGTNTSLCGQTPECYMELLRPSSNAIREIAPGAKITGPALGAIDDWWAEGGQAYTWFQRFVEMGGHTYVDDITIHNYSLPTEPEGYSERAVANAIKILKAAGSNQAVVFEEGGYNTVQGGHPEFIQAVMLARDSAAVLAAGADRYMHYNLVDNWNVPNNPEATFGLFHHEDAHNGRFEPKRGAITQAVLSRYLNGAVTEGAVTLGADARTSAFKLQNGKSGYIAWSTKQMHALIIDGGGNKTAMDIYGRPVELHSDGDRSVVLIGGFPIMITTDTPAALSIHVEPETPASEPAPSESTPSDPAPAEPVNNTEPESGTLSSSVPTVSGANKVGETLTANAGSWGPEGVEHAYQWNSVGVPVSGATASTYEVKPEDFGKVLSVTVTGSKSGYTSKSETSENTAEIMKGSLKTTASTISGTVKAGHRLTVNHDEWGPAPVDMSYRWLRDGVIISGATASSYLLTGDDTGKKITAHVIGRKAGYVAVYRPSAATVAVAPGDLKGDFPTITGETKVGSTLTANPGLWTAGTTVSYQWYRDGVAISGGTGKYLKLTEADRGKQIKVRALGKKPGYTSRAYYSYSTAKIS